ncbi:hypothetical protein PoB_005369400 [Plakobranchus ocellatus]|uniref:Uncharacterized protein n=1 Tax=Plakobranchus ocellatus TaxID=259542 RepID=A0AAV4C801_9GAST|nr:hypothetical protein PoB_005369400 [Plakobranchus ocellatus]
MVNLGRTALSVIEISENGARSDDQPSGLHVSRTGLPNTNAEIKLCVSITRLLEARANVRGKMYRSKKDSKYIQMRSKCPSIEPLPSVFKGQLATPCTQTLASPVPQNLDVPKGLRCERPSLETSPSISRKVIRLSPWLTPYQ